VNGRAPAGAAVGLKAACLNHTGREVAARCMGCGKGFCRECVTPFERRMFCVGCHPSRAGAEAKARRDVWMIFSIVQVVAGGLLLWWSAYLLGCLLMRIPASFHEGTIWSRFSG
jgi:hypothetical protein